MPIEITVPRLGWSMDEGTFAEWLMNHGDLVQKGSMLFVLEGDKAAQEVECFDEGRLQLLPTSPKPGDVVKVGQLLALLLSESEWAAAGSAPVASAPVASTPAAQVPGAQVPVGSAPATPVPVASTPITTAPVASAGVVVQQSTVQEQQTKNSIQPGKIASPRAQRTAAALGIDWTQLSSTGQSGRISERDVLAAAALRTNANSGSRSALVAATPDTTAVAVSSPVIEQAPPIQLPTVEQFGNPAPAASPAQAPSGAAPSGASPATSAVTGIPSSQRRTIAQRMLASHLTTAPVTLSTTVDMTNLVSLRAQFSAASSSSSSPPPSYTDFVVRLTAAALRAHPQMNLLGR